MENIFTLFLSSVISFFTHHFGEKFLTKNRKKKIRLILKGYQIHHSVWGLIAILIAFLTTGLSSFILLGYGIGNIWQHKKTHNQANEKGMVFITKTDKPLLK